MKTTLAIAVTLAFCALAFVPGAAAQPGGEPQCLQYYQEYDLGPVRIVKRDSCHTEYYVCDRTPGEALAAEKPLDCLIG